MHGVAARALAIYYNISYSHSEHGPYLSYTCSHEYNDDPSVDKSYL